MRVLYKTIVECKHYKYPINRVVVQKVYDNLQAIDVQKGIVISDSNFQSGTIKYAQVHGSVLMQLTEIKDNYYARSDMNAIMNYPYVSRSESCLYIDILQ